MPPTLQQQLAGLVYQSPAALRRRYAELFGESCHTGNKAWLIKRIAWRLQSLAQGDLSERARKRAAELANDADLRLSPPRTVLVAPVPQSARPGSQRSDDARLPSPGTVLTRRYKGRTLQVRILEQGFEYDGVLYPSLSAVAKAITDSHCNGFLFFRLTTKKGATS
jgi:Protein of unknown function (DUF2924)